MFTESDGLYRVSTYEPLYPEADYKKILNGDMALSDNCIQLHIGGQYADTISNGRNDFACMAIFDKSEHEYNLAAIKHSHGEFSFKNAVMSFTTNGGIVELAIASDDPVCIIEFGLMADAAKNWIINNGNDRQVVHPQG